MANAAEYIPKLEDILRAFGPEGFLAIQKSVDHVNPQSRMRFLMKEAERIKDKLDFAMKYRAEAVSVRQFVEDKYYLDMKDILFPKVLDELEELNSGKYVEAVLTGAIGTGKTTVALVTTAYQLYILSLYVNPHAEFSISPTDEIIIIFQSITAKLSKSVDYERFRQMIERSPYFREKFPFDKELKSELRFPNRIIVKPIAGGDTAAIGQNVIGGILDEVNFMKVTENSKQSKDGGVHDQAWENYRAIVRRRESRFMKKGRLPGMLCLVSSKQYPGEFTEVKANEARTNPRIFVYDKRVWEIKPPETFSGEWFNVFIGDPTRKPRMLEKHETILPEDRHLVIAVPEEYRPSFDQDILASLRDIAGVSTLALHPFITDVERVVRCFGTTESILSRDDCEFTDSSYVLLYPEKIKNREQPRFVHLDLAISSDSAGVACGYVDGFVKIPRGDFDYEILPRIVFDFVLEVKPPKNDEINFFKIRELLYKVRDAGCPIKWVTADTYQSTDTLQVLRQKGFITGEMSLDTDTRGYDFFKSALMDGRVKINKQAKAYNEVIHLERDPKKNKIDHPPKGSKDCADAMAGVVFGLTMRREIWLEHDIPLTEIPQSIIMAGKTKSKNSIEGREARELMNGTA